MKNKKLAIIFTVIGFLLILSGSLLTVFNIIKDDEKKKNENRDIIISNHEKFKERIDDFNLARSSVYENVLSGMFVESIEDYDKWISNLDSYTETIDNVVNNSDKLKNSCINLFYSSLDVKYKCDSFVIAYETAVNYYTKDIIEFNNNIKKINEELETPVDEYELKYEFIDINDDGKYYGKD